MYRLLIIIALSAMLLSAQACRSKGGMSGSPGISRPKNGGGTSAGPGIYRPKYVGVGHTPVVGGAKKKSDTFHGPPRQHGKKY